MLYSYLTDGLNEQVIGILSFDSGGVMSAVRKATHHRSQLGFVFSLWASYIPPLTGSMSVSLSPISLVSLALDTLSCIFCKTAVTYDSGGRRDRHSLQSAFFYSIHSDMK